MNKQMEPHERIAVERAVFQRGAAEPLNLGGLEIEDSQDHSFVDIFDHPENQMLKPQFDRLRQQIDQIGTNLE